MLRHTLGEIERARSAAIMGEHVRQFGLEGRIVLCLGVGAVEIEDERHQRLGDKAAAEEAKMAALVRTRAIGVERTLLGPGAHDAFF
jgi:hypothetical protein